MEPRSAGRVQSIDGLRGIAATLVVLFHLHGAVSRTAADWLWAPLDWIARHGLLGVDIFFVISGFVIALSVSRGAPTFGYLGRFVLRRSIRLDPPYWVAIALEVSLIFVTLRFFSGLSTATLPTAPQLFAHLVYSQELLGYEHIINIFWTLCYEIQFYAFFVTIVVIQAKLPAWLQGPRLAAAFCALTFVVSLWTRYWRPDWLPAGIAIDRWFQFFIGVLTWRVVTGRGSLGPLLAAWATLLAAVVVARVSPVQLLAIGVSGLLVLAARDVRLERILAARPLVMLGAMSYSIYLYHSSVGWRFISLLQRMMPGPWSPPMAVGVFLLGTTFAIAFAALLWWLVERPCLKLSQRISLPLRADRPSPVAPAGAQAAL